MHIRWRGMELPNALEVDRDTLTETYGKFSAEPFERGFGVSVGNSLRRVLLSSLMGSAVTQIKIRGAQHEFTTIPGVLEDITEIVLNVKSLVVRNHSDATRVITIESDKAGVITGGDVITDSDVEVINKNHVIATLTSDVPFMMEMVVENGRGYVPSAKKAQYGGSRDWDYSDWKALYSVLSPGFVTRCRKHESWTRKPTSTSSI